ncbi:MAG: hypothetical protein JW704_06345 [Anaerolineaceae bacterium]|nr:hypothetical protein [Anaerolineaceae bacterium]MBN2678502.1 hypothetical protein [Anaerolineaceae bacterium]
MQLPLAQFFALLDSPQAGLILYLVLSILVIISLAVSFNCWKQLPSDIAKRLALGFLVILLMELGSLAITALLSGDPLLSETWLPPLDRFQMGFILLWLMWLWAFPKPSLWADALAGIFSVGLFSGLVLTILVWSPLAHQTRFNAFWLDLTWQTYCMILLISVIVIIYAGRNRLWGVGMITCLILMVGHILQLTVPDLSGHYSGQVRLASLIAYPFMLLLPLRFVTQMSTSHQAGFRTGSDKRDRRRYSTELRTALSFLSLAWEENPQSAMQQLVKSFGQALLADVCLFTSSPDRYGRLNVLAGYDFSRNLKINEAFLSHTQVPLVVEALKHANVLRLPEDHSATPDISNLCKLINHDGNAPALIHPVSTENAWGIGAIILMTPFSRRPWVSEDSIFIASMVKALIHIIEHNQAGLNRSDRIQQLTSELSNSSQQIARLQQKMNELSLQLETLKLKKAETKSDTIKLEPLVVAKHEADQQIARLRAENAALRDQIIQLNGLSSDDIHLGQNQQAKELRLSLEEVARLQNKLALADMKVNQLERKLKANT